MALYTLVSDTMNIYLFERCRTITMIDEQLYYYLQRQNSIMHTTYSSKSLNHVEAYYEFYKYLKANFFSEEIINKTAKMTIHLYAILRWRMLLKEIRNDYIKYIDECFIDVYDFCSNNFISRSIVKKYHGYIV